MILSSNSSKYFAVITFCVCCTKACFFSKKDAVKYPERDHWDSQSHSRQYSENFKCDCGEDTHYVLKPWNFNVHIKMPTWTRTCTGTLITSNLVITSHTCLIRDGKMSPYEAWNPGPKNKIINGGTEARATPENMKLTSHPKENSNPTPDLSVSKIVYNPRFTINSASNSFPDDDLAILVLTQHISLQHKYRPICLPKFDPNLDVSRQVGRYYGIGAQLTEDPTPDFRTASELVILEGSECDKEAGFGQFSIKNSLCVRFRLPPPSITGGPLMLRMVHDSMKEHERSAKSTAFLLGISSVASKKRKGTRLSYVYFTNIIPMIKYIELQAERYGSIWCQTPVKFQLKKKVPKDNVLQPWEEQSEDSYRRDESLDCVCGVKNNEASSRHSKTDPRISGGEEAMPYEFGWIARVTLQLPDGRNPGCGGSIINSLFVITAAHCVVSISKLISYGKDAEDKILPLGGQVYISSHSKNNDPHEQLFRVKKVFVHPEYIQGEWEYQERNANKPDYNFYVGSDLALLLLDRPITFANSGTQTSTDIRPVCLPKLGKVIELIGKKATVSGWGVINSWAPPSKRQSSEVLQKLEKPILPLIKCSSPSEVVMTDDVICAGYLDRSKDSASGDSGGPLIIKHEQSGKWVQVGVVSYGVDYFEGRKYKMTTAHYTNVQNFLRFVDFYSKSQGAKWCRSTI